MLNKFTEKARLACGSACYSLARKTYSAIKKIDEWSKPFEAGYSCGSRSQRLVRFGLKVFMFESYIESHIKRSKKKGFEKVKDGLARFTKETFCYDAPITADIYEAGKSDGRRIGFAEASKLLGEEVRALAQRIVEIKKRGETLTAELKEKYTIVINAYDVELEKIKQKAEFTESENKLLRELLSEYMALKAA